MKNNYNKYARLYSIIAIAVMSATMTTVSAQVNTLYHMETVSTRHEMNPSFQPVPNGYYSTIPVFSGFYLGAGNNSLTFEDVLLPRGFGGNKQATWFFNNERAINDFYKNLKNTTRIYSEADFRLFAFGIRILDSSYLTVGINTKVNANVFIPQDMAKLLTYGAVDTIGVNSFNFDRLGVRANAYTELAVGYSQKVLPKLTVGGKLKFLIGHANTTVKVDRFKLNASRERWDFNIRGDAYTSVPNAKYVLDDKNKPENVKFNFDNFAFGNVIGGFGVAIDLGANYKLLNDQLTVSASVLDLGFISWKAKNSAHTSFDGSYDFEGIEFEFKDGIAEWDEGYFDNIEENIDYTTKTNSSYISTLAAKVFLGAEYRILDNKFAVGALSKSTIVNKSVFEEITASFNYLQFKFFNASLSYSLFDGRFSTIGLGLGGRLGPLNIYLAGDYFPARYTAQYIPYKSKAFNLQMGILFNFGYKTKTKEIIKEINGI
jgi:hypothetical protein